MRRGRLAAPLLILGLAPGLQAQRVVTVPPSLPAPLGLPAAALPATLETSALSPGVSFNFPPGVLPLLTPGLQPSLPWPAGAAQGPQDAQPEDPGVPAQGQEPVREAAERAPTPEAAAQDPLGARAGSARTFDGAGGKPAPEGGVVAEALARFGVRRTLLLPAPSRTPAPAKGGRAKAKDEEDTLDELGLFFKGANARSLLDSHIWGDVKLIKPSSGSKWWWNRFKPGETIRVKAGSEWLFYTVLTDAKTKPIGKLSKTDLSGIFSEQDLARHGVDDLRQAVAERLRTAHKGQFEVTSQTPVRVVHFKTPKQLGQDARAGAPKHAVYDPFARRRELKLPADSPLRRLNEFFPKAVMVDLEMFDGPIAPELIEDMGKLQRAGVKFVFFSDKAGADHTARTAQILDGLYGSIFAMDGGALITQNSRDVSITRSADLLSDYDRQAMLEHSRIAAYELGLDANEVLESPLSGSSREGAFARAYFRARLPAGADAGAFKSRLEARLAVHDLGGEVVLGPEAPGASRGFVIQRSRIVRSMPKILRALQEMGVYANPQEILVVSDDADYARAVEAGVQSLVAEDSADGVRPGAIRPAADAAALAGVPLKGTELLENALGAVLGEYRQNQKGDFITSASALDSFAHHTNQYFERELLKGEENVYAFWGHETHDVMNWVGWVQRNTGTAPTEEQAMERLRRHWDDAIHSADFNVYLNPGRGFVDLREAAAGRLRGIYQVYARVMAIPGARFIGTELPNIFSLQAFDRKKGEVRRVFIRTIFDMVAVIPNTDGGSSVWIMDFKSGVKPTQEVLAKKIQPRTYRLFTHYKWERLPAEYAIAGEETTPVSGTQLEFFYNRSAIPIPLNDWHDGRTELEILRLAERMRQDKQRTHLRPKRKRGAAKASPGAAPGQKRAPVKVDSSRPKSGDFSTLALPRTVPGLKIKRQFAQQFVKGTKKIEYRSSKTKPKPFVAIIQTYTDDEPGRPAEVVAFARIEKAVFNGGEWEWHVSHVTPVKPYIVPNNKPGSIIWVKDVPVQGPRRLKK